jgi:2-polyprenyl-6-hydroxyphenyl methylase/3-demethylubiquinone-9 3-methyltransferase
VHDRLLHALEGERLGRVLDVGSGDGTFAARLAAESAQVTGLDPAPTALARARAAHPELEFVAPAVDGGLPFPDASFDAVTCVNVLQHVADTQALLSEVRRVLVADGLLAVAVPFHGRLRNALVALGSFERHYDPLAPEVRFYTARSLRALLHDFGFEQVRVAARGGPPLLRETLVALGRRASLGR